MLLIDSPDFHLPRRLAPRERMAGTNVYAVPHGVGLASVEGEEPPTGHGSRLPLFQFEHEYLLGPGSIRHGKDTPSWTTAPLSRRRLIRSGSPSSGEQAVRSVPPPAPGGMRLPLKDRGYRPVFSIAPGMPEDLRNRLRNVLMAMKREGPGRNLLASSAAAAGASGTVAVEAM